MSHERFQKGISSDRILRHPNSSSAIGTFRNLPMSSAIQCNHYGHVTQMQQLRMLDQADYLCTPAISNSFDENDSLTGAAFAFIRYARSQLVSGASIHEILSLDGTDVELCYRDRRPTDPHTVSTWACELNKTWPHFPLTLRLAAVHSVASFIRWLMIPARETWL